MNINPHANLYADFFLVRKIETQENSVALFSSFVSTKDSCGCSECRLLRLVSSKSMKYFMTFVKW